MKEESIKEIRKYFDLKCNEDKMYPNLGNMAKTVRGKFMPLNACISEKS